MHNVPGCKPRRKRDLPPRHANQVHETLRRRRSNSAKTRRPGQHPAARQGVGQDAVDRRQQNERQIKHRRRLMPGCVAWAAAPCAASSTTNMHEQLSANTRACEIHKETNRSRAVIVAEVLPRRQITDDTGYHGCRTPASLRPMIASVTSVEFFSDPCNRRHPVVILP